MLAIRMQRTGRSGHAQYRVVVQDSRRTPTSGKIVAQVGSYDPHTKAALLNSERIGHFLSNGAQPSDRVALLLKKEGIKLPKWVTLPVKQKSAIKNSDKLRRNRPAEPKAAAAEGPAKPEVAEQPEAAADTAEAAGETGESQAAEQTASEADSADSAPAKDSEEEAPADSQPAKDTA